MLPEISLSRCSIPPYPGGEIFGTVGTRRPDDNIMLCGGYANNSALTGCHTLSLDDTWVPAPPMLDGRVDGAAGWVGSEWMVTGGSNGEVGGWLASTELFKDGEWSAGTDLPVAVQGHCMVQLNNTHVLYSGGWEEGGNVSRSSYIYSKDQGWRSVGNMGTGRAWHGCSVVGDDVWVVGGNTGHGDTDTTEILSLASNTWSPGPSIPIQGWGGRLAVVQGLLLYVGGWLDRGIYKLHNRNWIRLLETDTERSQFSIVLFENFGCN